MNSVTKFAKRFVGILTLGTVLVLIMNVVIVGMLTINYSSNGSPWTAAKEAAANLRQTKKGYELSEEMSVRLETDHVWAIFIDNTTLRVVWHTDNLPDSIPMTYTVSDIAGLTRGYIDGYPTFSGEDEKGLMVLGYPKDSYWKHMWPSWDYRLIGDAPKIVLFVLAINIEAVFLIYTIANIRLLKSIKPLTNGIQALPSGESVCVREKGLLSEVAANINKTSEILQTQKIQLRKKETARANWIAGVSHDIRTPLSMIMGYAGQLEESVSLSETEHAKAVVIVRQSERIRQLVNDLNLASKLEYNMQPVHLERQNMIALVRQVIVDFMNMDLADKYPIEWETDEALTVCMVNVDKDLMKRAVSNLIWNSMNHNEQGCRIFVCVKSEGGICSVTVSDDGIGADDEQIDKLNHAPHYMVCDENVDRQRHGLGLLIVKQIVSSHDGTVTIGHGTQGGFCVEIIMKMEDRSV